MCRAGRPQEATEEAFRLAGPNPIDGAERGQAPANDILAIMLLASSAAGQLYFALSPVTIRPQKGPPACAQVRFWLVFPYLLHKSASAWGCTPIEQSHSISATLILRHIRFVDFPLLRDTSRACAIGNLHIIDLALYE